MQSCSINMDQPGAHGNNNRPGVPHQQNEGVSKQIAGLACSRARLVFWKRPQAQKGLGRRQEAADNRVHSEQMSPLSRDRDPGPKPVLYCRQERDSHLGSWLPDTLQGTEVGATEKSAPCSLGKPPASPGKGECELRSSRFTYTP